MSVKKKDSLLGNVKAHKMPDKSVFYDRVAPVLFIALGVIMAALVVFAIGVLTGIVPWR